jgi:hypothetical protein
MDIVVPVDSFINNDAIILTIMTMHIRIIGSATAIQYFSKIALLIFKRYISRPIAVFNRLKKIIYNRNNAVKVESNSQPDIKYTIRAYKPNKVTVLRKQNLSK